MECDLGMIGRLNPKSFLPRFQLVRQRRRYCDSGNRSLTNLTLVAAAGQVTPSLALAPLVMSWLSSYTFDAPLVTLVPAAPDGPSAASQAAVVTIIPMMRVHWQNHESRTISRSGGNYLIIVCNYLDKS